MTGEPTAPDRAAAPRPPRGEPNHCPYCGDENLHPHGEAAGGWECRSCLRAFSLSLTGLIRPEGGLR